MKTFSASSLWRPRNRALKVRPLNLHDLSYITAYMRDPDHTEVFSQRHDVNELHLAYELMHYATKYGHVVMMGYRPIAAFGAVEWSANVYTGWSFGTAHYLYAVPTISRYIASVIPRFLRRGMQRFEVRALNGHPDAHRFLQRLGGTPTLLESYGKNGEDFVMYSWTRKRIEELYDVLQLESPRHSRRSANTVGR